ncbi:MAG: CTP synthase [Thaumarchaeota archaeon]|nr:CTP synthase [Nitrososphaerota archaeon]
MPTDTVSPTQRPKYIFVTGGVMSGLGKGIVAASIAKLLQLDGFRVTCIKVDPYINVDAGTMNPIMHGEVFVTDDGGETDMDLGTYERFLDANLSKEHNITTGQVYLDVIEAERRGEFLGKCVQIIPHVTDAIKESIRKVAVKNDVDVLIVECGGTVGDIEGLPFLEALRQMRLEEGSSNCLFIHLTLAPVLDAVGEEKTKPTQHSVQELRRIGIQPDIIVVRSKRHISDESKKKIAMFCSVDMGSVISDPDAESIYNVPETLHTEGILNAISEKLHLPKRPIDWNNWVQISRSFAVPKDEIKIAMVGKYVTLADSYVSVNQALHHAGAAHSTKVKVDCIESEDFEKNPTILKRLDEYHGILIPGGFGRRGSEGKILAANYARERGIPYLGLCFGFQLAVVAFARHVCGLNAANSTELDPNTKHSVIDILPSQKGIANLGATMRLGGHDIDIQQGSIASRLYGAKAIRQRHRHRYEFNQNYMELFESKGLHFSGFSDNRLRAEILEIPSHPFYLATQYHPEFVSRPGRPEPVFNAFIGAAVSRKRPIAVPTAGSV